MKITGFQFGALAVIVVGAVLLGLFDRPTGSYIALVTPLLAAMYLDGRTEKQNETLDKIQENTNGVLTKRIEQAVNNVLDARASGEAPGGVIPPE